MVSDLVSEPVKSLDQRIPLRSSWPWSQRPRSPIIQGFGLEGVPVPAGASQVGFYEFLWGIQWGFHADLMWDFMGIYLYMIGIQCGWWSCDVMYPPVSSLPWKISHLLRCSHQNLHVYSMFNCHVWLPDGKLLLIARGQVWSFNINISRFQLTSVKPRKSPWIEVLRPFRSPHTRLELGLSYLGTLGMTLTHLTHKDGQIQGLGTRRNDSIFLLVLRCFEWSVFQGNWRLLGGVGASETSVSAEFGWLDDLTQSHGWKGQC